MEVQSLDMEALETALDCLRQGLPLDSAHPLAQFISLRAHLPRRLVTSLARDYLIFDGLCRLIRGKLKWQRARCRLLEDTPLKPSAPEERLKKDFQQANRELEAWSLLYHRFVRVDLDLSMEKISILVGQTMRTLNRRQHLGLTRLVHLLIQREAKAIRVEHQAYLRACLPCPAAPVLYERERYVEWATNYLLTNPPGHLCIFGRPGVGKTALALGVAHRLIEHGMLHTLLWLERPEASLEWLAQMVGQHLSLQPDDLLNLSTYLTTHPILLILDDAATLLQEDRVWKTIEMVFRHAYIIVTTESYPRAYLPMGYVKLPALDKGVCLEWLTNQTFVPERHQQQFLDRFEQVFDQFGGNLNLLRHELCQ